MPSLSLSASNQEERNEVGTYTIREVAEKLQCSVRHVHRLIAQNRIPGVFRIGRLRRFRKRLIDRWLAEG